MESIVPADPVDIDTLFSAPRNGDTADFEDDDDDESGEEHEE